MLLIRRLLFAAWLYLSIAVVGILLTPMLFAPRRLCNRALGLWSRVVLFGLRWIMGVRVEVRGLEHKPSGSALLGGKHQSMLDIIIPFGLLDDPCMVYKKELTYAPFIGWFAWKTRMIAVDRSAHAAALKKLVADTRDRMKNARQVVIFPEGTRTAPGAEAQYKPGIAALYRELDSPCSLMATNSGVCWPAHGIGFNPGVVVFEFLPPIPAGLKRGQFMAELSGRLETASKALLPG